MTTRQPDLPCTASLRAGVACQAMTLMMLRRFWKQTCAGLFVLFLAGCATNPVTGSRDLVLMSEQQEVELGRKEHQKILQAYTIYENPRLQAMVERIGQNLARRSHRQDLNFTFTLLDSPEVNAFALPGGYIYITRGILAYMNSEEELAGVLGHEIGHVTARHGVRQHTANTASAVATLATALLVGNSAVTQSATAASTALVRGYGRNHELEADRLGAEYLAKTGYNPQKMLDVVEILKNQESYEIDRARKEGRQPRAYHGVFSTHPSNDKRLQEVIAAADRFKQPGQQNLATDDFLQSQQNMTFGNSASQGVVRGNRFYHQQLDMSATFPQGWKIDNRPTTLVAISPQRDAFIQLQLADGEATSPEQLLRQQFKGLREPQRLSGNAFTGVIDGKTPFGEGPVRVAAKRHGDHMVIFTGIAKGRPLDDQVFRTMDAVRTLNREERELAKSHSIKVVRAKPGDTFAKLARNIAVDDAESQLRLLNGMYPNGQPRAGQLIKIIQ